MTLRGIESRDRNKIQQRCGDKHYRPADPPDGRHGRRGVQHGYTGLYTAYVGQDGNPARRLLTAAARVRSDQYSVFRMHMAPPPILNLLPTPQPLPVALRFPPLFPTPISTPIFTLPPLFPPPPAPTILPLF